MKKIAFFALFTFFLSCRTKEIVVPPTNNTLYFPPTTSDTWETTTPESLNLNAAAIVTLYNYLEMNKTKGFIVLRNGKIVLEKYFNGHTQASNWYWASAGKTLTSFMVGKAQEEGFLKITDKSSLYLKNNWTSLSLDKENAITIRHQLTMTTGLDDAVTESSNFTPANLRYKADAGTRWAYHNAPYTILEKVVEAATKMTFDTYFNTKLRTLIGMNGLWTWVGNDHVYWSTTRSMARYGLLILNNGKWDTQNILKDPVYLTEMVNTSQNINKSYGYLWWLNGKSTLMAPTSQTVFQSDLCVNAPKDMFAAMGKNGQFINIVKSKGLVIVRMGETASTDPVVFNFQNELWNKLTAIGF